MRPTRVLLAVSAAALVSAACGDDSTAGAGAPASASGSGPAAATTSASATPAASDVSTLEASEILTRAKAAFKKADSVRLVGGGTSGGESFTVDMRYSQDKAIGTVGNGTQKIELRRIGKTVYLRADKAFWTQTAGAEAAKVLADKYLKAPLTDQRVAQLAEFTDKDQFVEEILDPDGSVTKSGSKTIRGVAAVGLVESADKTGGTLYVATTGEPVPLQLAPEAGSKESGALDFLDYGKTVQVEIPPAAQTIDVTKLGSK